MILLDFVFLLQRFLKNCWADLLEIWQGHADISFEIDGWGVGEGGTFFFSRIK